LVEARSRPGGQGEHGVRRGAGAAAMSGTPHASTPDRARWSHTG
jgi:hypothetical protein